MAGAMAVAGWAAAPASAETVYGVTDGNKLVTFDSKTPGAVSAPVAIMNLAANETIKSIDVRPATLQLYALGSTGQLYRIDVVSGAASPVGPALSINGTDADIDFNPTVDRLRIVTDGEQNLRINPNSGAIAATDTNLAPAGNVTGAAYTNNAPASAAFPNVPTTQLFDIDTASDRLLLQNPPNNGTLVDVGALGVDLVGKVGFDISTTNNGPNGQAGTNAAYVVGRTSDGNDRLYGVNITTGAATPVGDVAGDDKVRDIAVAAPVPQIAVLISGAGGTGQQQLATVRADRPGSTNTPVNVTGLQAGESLVGIDRRPANGALFGYTNQNRIYTLNMDTGAAAQVGAAALNPALTGTSPFGFDFNPTVDRIRLVNAADETARANPDTGARADAPADGTLAYAPADVNAGQNPNVTAAGYTNSFPGAETTTLFDLDTGLDILATQNPPNAGTLNTIGVLNVTATDENGFDIARRFNQQFAALQTTALGASTLYAVNVAGTGGPPLTAANGSAASIGGLGLPTGRFAQGIAIVRDDVLPAPPVPTTPVPGVTPTVTPSVTPSVTVTATPTYTVPPSGKKTPGLTGKVRPRRDVRKPFKFVVRGLLKRPSGVSKSAGCKGKIKVTVKKGKKTVGKRTVSVRSACKYVARVKLGKKAGAKGKAKFTIAFQGNTKLKKKTIKRSAAFGKK